MIISYDILAIMNISEAGYFIQELMTLRRLQKVNKHGGHSNRAQAQIQVQKQILILKRVLSLYLLTHLFYALLHSYWSWNSASI